MGDLYLNTGESIILTANRVSVNFIPFDIILTNQRLIFIDSTYARFEPQMVPLGDIFSVKAEKIATGEPVISLTLAASGLPGTHESMDLLFTQQPGERRKPEGNEWLRKLMENIVEIRQKSEFSDNLPSEQDTGMRPAIRRWIAPEILEPHKVVTAHPDLNTTVSLTPSKQEVLPGPPEEGSVKPQEIVTGSNSTLPKPAAPASGPDRDQQDLGRTERSEQVRDRSSVRTEETESPGKVAERTEDAEIPVPVSTVSGTPTLQEERAAGPVSTAIQPPGGINPEITAEPEGELLHHRPAGGMERISPEHENPVHPSMHSAGELTGENKTGEIEPTDSTSTDTGHQGSLDKSAPVSETTVHGSQASPLVVEWPVIQAKKEENIQAHHPASLSTKDDEKITDDQSEPDRPMPSGVFEERTNTNSPEMINWPVIPEKGEEKIPVSLPVPSGTCEDQPAGEEKSRPDFSGVSVPEKSDLPDNEIATVPERKDIGDSRDINGDGRSEAMVNSEPAAAIVTNLKEMDERNIPEIEKPVTPVTEPVRPIPEITGISTTPETSPPDNGTMAPGVESPSSQTEGRHRPGRGTIVGVIVILVIFAFTGAAIFLSHNPAGGNAPQLPAVIATPTINQTPEQPVVSIPETGVWVRVIYDRHYYGRVGNPGDLSEVSGTGDQFYPIRNSDNLVQVSLQKQDNSGEPLTVMIYRNGTAVYQDSTRIPRGDVSNLIDPRTGNPPAAVTPANP